MELNLLAILACGVFSMILGTVWYGVLFKDQWMKIIGADKMSKKEQEQMQKETMPLYGVAFILALFQAFVLANYINGWKEASGVENALWIFAAFVMPTVAGGSMWNNDSRKIMISRFMVQTGYYLVLFIVFGLILGYWR